MLAAGLSREGTLEVKDVEVPRLRGGDLLVDMRACGLCGSDLEKLSGEYTAAPPVIGHEAVGVVAEVGDGVEGFAEGDRVFPHHHVPCNDCHYCRGGSPTMCPEYRAHHLDPGGFAESFRVSSWIVRGGGVLLLPDNLAFDQASFIEPLACCLRAMDRVSWQETETALVVGGGPMGALLLRLLPGRGLDQPLLSEPSAVRREIAGRGGAVQSLDPTSLDVPDEVRSLTDGRGADVVFTASGHPAALEDALSSVRPGGTVALVGIPEGASQIPEAARLVTREVSLVASNAATDTETARAMALLDEGTVEVADLITHRVPLRDLAEAVPLAARAETMKVVVVSP
jgi:L-iditol 2-dehydrogenase